MKNLNQYLLIFLLLLSSCAHRGKDWKNESDKLNQIITRYSGAVKKQDPFGAAYFNVEEDLSKFGDYPSPEYFERSKLIYKSALDALTSVEVTKLAAKDHRTYRLFKEDMETSLKYFDHPNRYLSFTQMGSRLRAYLNDSSESLTSFPFDSVKHYEDFWKRSEGFPVYVDRQIALLREGIEKKITLSCIVARKTRSSYSEGLESRIEKNPFYRPILFMPKSFSREDRERLAESYHQMVRERILPGFRKFDRFFTGEYLKNCRKSFGLAGLPDARNWYRDKIRENTGLDTDSQVIHETGLAEVKRIVAEMDKIKIQLGFRGDHRAFVRSLVKNPRYFFKSSAEMFRAFELVKSNLTKIAPQYFSKIPESDYKIVESSNPQDASGSYQGPTENLPYGRFIVNTKNLRSVPTYGVTTLSLHETVPGHHFQIALQFEMKKELSEYQRKMYDSNAFVEGWALYAEYLGNEMGVFTDPLQKLGNLNDDMLRAVRLVVDTGIHAFGWSQARARQYMQKYLASDAQSIEIEVNRYSVWPGQALGYKIGQLKIIELRRMAEKSLGPQFNLEEFHGVVIGSGIVSLTELDVQVREWISSKVPL